MSDEGSSGFGILRRRRPILGELRPRVVGKRLVETAREERSRGRIHEPGSMIKIITEPLRSTAERMRKKRG